MHSLSWNLGQRTLFLSGSWDDSIKLWDVNRPTSLNTFLAHTYCVYGVVWCVYMCGVPKPVVAPSSTQSLDQTLLYGPPSLIAAN